MQRKEPEYSQQRRGEHKGRCSSVREWLLGKPEANKDDISVEAHLRECPACREYQADLCRLREIVAASGRVELPAEYLEDFTLRLIRRLETSTRGMTDAGSLRAGTWILIIAQALAGLGCWVFAPLVLLFLLIGRYQRLSMLAALLSSMCLVAFGLVMGLLIVTQVSQIALKPERMESIQDGLLE